MNLTEKIANINFVKRKHVLDDMVYEENTELIQIAKLSNIGSRESQQDSYGVSDIDDMALLNENGMLALVADGMGGLGNGSETSNIVAKVFLDHFRSEKILDNQRFFLMRMVQEANRSVVQYLSKCGENSGGSTVVATAIKGNKLSFISVGDSKIYLLRNHSLLQLNREHTYMSELDESAAKGDISLREALENPQRKSLTSYIGMSEVEKMDYNLSPITVACGDTILLMSDGVFGTLSESEIVMAVDTVNLDQAAQQLQHAVLEKRKKSQDNFTCVMIRINY